MSSEMPLEEVKTGGSGCRRESYYIENRLTGQKLFARYWFPKDESSIQGLVFISHGFAEHLAYYNDFAAMLADRNIIAFGHDHLGHGLSEGKRGTIDSIDLHVDEVFVHVAKIKARYLDVPCFIFGHSMGGLIAIKAVLKNRSFFRGIVLEGPLVVPSSRPSFIMSQVAKVANILIPDYVYLNMNLDDVTNDQANVKLMENDPLRWHGGIKVSMATAFNDALKGLLNDISQMTIPFLILHSEEDQLCDVEGSRQMYKKSRSKDKQLITFPGAGHNLFLEQTEIRLQAMSESVTWFQRRCSTRITTD